MFVLWHFEFDHMGIKVVTAKRYGSRPAPDVGSLPSDPLNDSLTRVIVGETSTSKLEPESRVRPPPPLVLSPTSRALQSASVRTFYRGSVEYIPETLTGVTIRVTPGSQGVYFGWPVTPSVPEDTWITPLRNKIKSVDISLGESVFEFRETANMFYNAAKSVAGFVQGVREARKGNFRAVKRRIDKSLKGKSLKDLSSAHLGTALGLAPTLGVAVDSYFALMDKLNADTDFLVWKKFVQKTSLAEQSSSSWTWKANGNVPCVVQSTVEKRVQQRAVIYVAFRPGKTYGFTMGNPLEVGWELVPLSFVLDWFIPVGAFLKSLDALQDVVEVRGGTVSTHTFLTRAVKPQDTVAPHIKTLYGYQTAIHTCHDPQHEITHTWKRDLFSGIPLPPLPRWAPSASWYKLSIAVALFHQARAHL